jgi:histidinol-phosphate phosphatase family protein
MLQRCVFLDRDGTIIVERNYLGDPEGVEIEHGVVESLQRMARMGYIFVVVSNQSGVARGLITTSQVNSVNLRVTEILNSFGIKIAAQYFCPHQPGDICDCRKPAIGMVKQAAEDLKIDLFQSIMIGDKDIDLIMAARAGMEGYLVLTGHGRHHIEWASTHGFEVHNTIVGVADSLSAKHNELPG